MSSMNDDGWEKMEKRWEKKEWGWDASEFHGETHDSIRSWNESCILDKVLSFHQIVFYVYEDEMLLSFLLSCVLCILCVLCVFYVFLLDSLRVFVSVFPVLDCLRCVPCSLSCFFSVILSRSSFSWLLSFSGSSREEKGIEGETCNTSCLLFLLMVTDFVPLSRQTTQVVQSPCSTLIHFIERESVLCAWWCKSSEGKRNASPSFPSLWEKVTLFF